MLRCQCGIDVHAHVVPENFPAYIGSSMPADWPSMAAAQPCHRSVMIAGKNYRTISDHCWTPSKRIADFAELGLRLQAISPMPELLSYWMKPLDAQQLLRYTNDQIASMVNESNGQLTGLGAVPLQDINLAIKELEYCVNTLGFSGVELGSNINGIAIGDIQFDPFFEACEALNAAVFVHAIRPNMDRISGPTQLQQVLGYSSDIGLAAASAITSNLIVRRPKLRIAFSHGGGTLSALLPRLEQGYKCFPALKESLSASPLEQARKLYFDTLVFDSKTLKHITDLFGSNQLMVGTDYPFNFSERAPVAALQAAGLDQTMIDQISFKNAERFLNYHPKADTV